MSNFCVKCGEELAENVNFCPMCGTPVAVPKQDTTVKQAKTSTESETIATVKSKQGILGKIQNFVLGGYSTKEDLRELDKNLRDFYYMDLREMRHTWVDVYLSVLEDGVKVSNRDLKKVVQVLDRFMEKVRHADYGYAGLFDRKGKINETELARVFNFDKELSGGIERMEETVNKTRSDAESEDWNEVKVDVKKVKDLLLGLEDKWNEREKLFRPVDM